jgi:hypothetical protein
MPILSPMHALMTIEYADFSESWRSVVGVSVSVVSSKVGLVGSRSDDLIRDQSRGAFGSS